MVRGLYTSALGMTTQMKKMDVVSNNIANVDTTGYKKDGVVTKSFDEELLYRLYDNQDRNYPAGKVNIGSINYGLSVDNIYTDFSSGSIKITNAPLDLTLTDSGFFVVNHIDKNGNSTEKYTRDGGFAINQEGALLTKDGYSVLGESGPIILPAGSVVINETGRIFVNNEYIDTIRTVALSDNTDAVKFGENLYNFKDTATVTAYTGGIIQGALEGSNVNSVREMVEMITLSRVYESNQKMIQTHDSILAKVVNDIGRRV